MKNAKDEKIVEKLLLTKKLTKISEQYADEGLGNFVFSDHPHDENR